MIELRVYLVDHLHEVPVQVLFCIEDQVRDLPLFAQATAYAPFCRRPGRLCWPPAHGSGLLLDQRAPHTRRRSGQAAQYPRQRDAVRAFAGGLYTGTDFKAARRIPATH